MTKNSSDLRQCLISVNESDRNLEPANVVDGLFAIARGLHAVAQSIEKLGISDASTPFGAVELLSMEIRDGFNNLNTAIGSALGSGTDG